jgi:hypothetical protein
MGHCLTTGRLSGRLKAAGWSHTILNIPCTKRTTNGKADYIFMQFTPIACSVQKHAVFEMKTVTERNVIGLLCVFVECSELTTEIIKTVDFCVS